MPTLHVRDDMGRDLYLSRVPERIVSLVPSDTHSLIALGAGPRLVGRTSWCDAPGVPEVGGTKDVDPEKVLALEPELVIANQEENSRVPLEQLAGKVPLLVSLPRRAADGIAHLARLARILRLEKGSAGAELVRRGYHLLRDAVTPRVRVFLPIWMDPLMTLNADTFGSDMLAQAGGHNVFDDRLRLYPLAADLGKIEPKDAGDRDVRYPRIRLDEIAPRAPHAILLPDEPHAFSDEDAALLAAAAPTARTVRVSGKDLFWYGAHQIEAIPRLRSVLAEIPAGDAG